MNFVVRVCFPQTLAKSSANISVHESSAEGKFSRLLQLVSFSSCYLYPGRLYGQLNLDT